MHDNIMQSAGSISSKLRARREELGLSLSEVARRAGTSAATLSRYENGWSRFETYTLRKLASALGCHLEINLCPRAPGSAVQLSMCDVVKQIGRLFWDHPLSVEDLDERPVWVVERVLEYGQIEDIRTLAGTLGRRAFLEAAASAYRVSPRTRHFWQQVLEGEGIQCTRRFSRNTAWNS